MSDTRIIRCAVCLAEFEELTMLEETSCPRCNTRVMPEYPDLDVTLTLNWDSLRMLANWASNWAKDTLEPGDIGFEELETILKKIRPHRPEEGEPLTLADAIDELDRMGIKLSQQPEPVGEKRVRVELVAPKTKRGSGGPGTLN